MLTFIILLCKLQAKGHLGKLEEMHTKTNMEAPNALHSENMRSRNKNKHHGAGGINCLRTSITADSKYCSRGRGNGNYGTNKKYSGKGGVDCGDNMECINALYEDAMIKNAGCSKSGVFGPTGCMADKALAKSLMSSTGSPFIASKIANDLAADLENTKGVLPSYQMNKYVNALTSDAAQASLAEIEKANCMLPGSLCDKSGKLLSDYNGMFKSDPYIQAKDMYEAAEDLAAGVVDEFTPITGLSAAGRFADKAANAIVDEIDSHNAAAHIADSYLGNQLIEPEILGYPPKLLATHPALNRIAKNQKEKVDCSLCELGHCVKGCLNCAGCVSEISVDCSMCEKGKCIQGCPNCNGCYISPPLDCKACDKGYCIQGCMDCAGCVSQSPTDCSTCPLYSCEKRCKDCSICKPSKHITPKQILDTGIKQIEEQENQLRKESEAVKNAIKKGKAVSNKNGLIAGAQAANDYLSDKFRKMAGIPPPKIKNEPSFMDPAALLMDDIKEKASAANRFPNLEKEATKIGKKAEAAAIKKGYHQKKARQIGNLEKQKYIDSAQLFAPPDDNPFGIGSDKLPFDRPEDSDDSEFRKKTEKSKEAAMIKSAAQNIANKHLPEFNSPEALAAKADAAAYSVASVPKLGATKATAEELLMPGNDGLKDKVARRIGDTAQVYAALNGATPLEAANVGRLAENQALVSGIGMPNSPEEGDALAKGRVEYQKQLEKGASIPEASSASYQKMVDTLAGGDIIKDVLNNIDDKHARLPDQKVLDIIDVLPDEADNFKIKNGRIKLPLQKPKMKKPKSEEEIKSNEIDQKLNDMLRNKITRTPLPSSLNTVTTPDGTFYVPESATKLIVLAGKAIFPKVALDKKQRKMYKAKSAGDYDMVDVSGKDLNLPSPTNQSSSSSMDGRGGPIDISKASGLVIDKGYVKMIPWKDYSRRMKAVVNFPSHSDKNVPNRKEEIETEKGVKVIITPPIGEKEVLSGDKLLRKPNRSKDFGQKNMPNLQSNEIVPQSRSLNIASDDIANAGSFEDIFERKQLKNADRKSTIQDIPTHKNAFAVPSRTQTAKTIKIRSEIKSTSKGSASKNCTNNGESVTSGKKKTTVTCKEFSDNCKGFPACPKGPQMTLEIKKLFGKHARLLAMPFGLCEDEFIQKIRKIAESSYEVFSVYLCEFNNQDYSKQYIKAYQDVQIIFKDSAPAFITMLQNIIRLAKRNISPIKIGKTKIIKGPCDQPPKGASKKVLEVTKVTYNGNPAYTSGKKQIKRVLVSKKGK